MSRVLNAVCRHVGIPLKLTLVDSGQLFNVFRFLFPHICRDCKEVFSGNLYEEPCSCTECGSAKTQVMNHENQGGSDGLIPSSRRILYDHGISAGACSVHSCSCDAS